MRHCSDKIEKSPPADVQKVIACKYPLFSPALRRGWGFGVGVAVGGVVAREVALVVAAQAGD